MIKPLSCPFCGKPPKISSNWGETLIYCNCHAYVQVNKKAVSIQNEDKKSWHYDYDRSEKEAIELWNHRVPEKEGD